MRKKRLLRACTYLKYNFYLYLGERRFPSIQEKLRHINHRAIRHSLFSLKIFYNGNTFHTPRRSISIHNHAAFPKDEFLVNFTLLRECYHLFGRFNLSILEDPKPKKKRRKKYKKKKRKKKRRAEHMLGPVPGSRAGSRDLPVGRTRAEAGAWASFGIPEGIQSPLNHEPPPGVAHGSTPRNK